MSINMNISIHIDRDSDTPVYLQIRNRIMGMILSGELPPGFRLPPERRLAESLGVNRTTVLGAYRELKADGFLDSHVGRGTVVLPHETGSAIPRGNYEPPVWRHFFSQEADRSSEPLLRDLLLMANRPDLISFAAGISSLETDPVEALEGMEAELISQPGHFALKHTPTEGLLSLRGSIAELMAQRGMRCSPEEILVLSGSQQGLDIAARIFLDPGDTVAVEEPSFFSALQIFQAAGARIVGIPMDEQGMRADVLDQAIQRYRPKFIYTMPTFQNPSGRTMALPRRKEILDIAYRRKTPILEDDPYGELRFEGPRLPTLKELDGYGYVIYLSSFSKILFPGLRIGWVTAPKPVIGQFAMIKQMTDLHSNSISQWIVDRFIQSGRLEGHMIRICGEYKARRDIMVEALQKNPVTGLTWQVPQGGFYLWCRLPEGVPHAALLARAAEKGVAYVPGTAFYLGGRGADHIRLNYTYPPRDSIVPGIAKLKEAIRETGVTTQSVRRVRAEEIKPIV